QIDAQVHPPLRVPLTIRPLESAQYPVCAIYGTGIEVRPGQGVTRVIPCLPTWGRRSVNVQLWRKRQNGAPIITGQRLQDSVFRPGCPQSAATRLQIGLQEPRHLIGTSLQSQQLEPIQTRPRRLPRPTPVKPVP